jgi:hypothetical protein
VVLNHIFQLKILHFTDLVNFIHYGSRKIKGNRTSGRYHHGLRVKVIGDGCSGVHVRIGVVTMEVVLG